MARPTLAWSLICTCLTTSVLADDVDYREKLSETENGVLAAINKERGAEGVDLAALKVNGKLLAAARIHARNMAAADVGGHELKDVKPEWRTPEERIKHVGYRGYAWGENVAWGYRRPEEVVEGWMNSEGHRRNMLSAEFEEIGVGVARGASGLYWCAVFGRSSPPAVRHGAGGPAPKPKGQDSPRQESAPVAGEAWRYRWHEGRWWYWLPSKRWAVWSDGRWIETQ